MCIIRGLAMFRPRVCKFDLFDISCTIKFMNGFEPSAHELLATLVDAENRHARAAVKLDGARTRFGKWIGRVSLRMAEGALEEAATLYDDALLASRSQHGSFNARPTS